MTGKERIRNAFGLKPVDQTPWLPFVGVHGGKLIGVSAETYLKSADHVVAGVRKAVEGYRADGVPVVFDLQIEAEALGCELNWAPDSPPAVVSHPLSAQGNQTLADLHLPEPNDGRIGLCLEATRRLREELPETALYGLITGPFTLALHLLGTEIFMHMFDDPAAVEKVLEFCKDVGCRMAALYIDAGCDVVAVVDPMTSQIGPDQFRQFVTPAATPVFDFIREKGALSSFFVCGHAEQNLQVMCDCKPDNLSVDENIPLNIVKSICLASGVSFGGNLQLTTVLLLGKPEDAQRDALDCLEIGGDKGFILAPGCDLPYDVPSENLSAISEILNDPYARDVALAREVVDVNQELLDLSDYGSNDKVVVDIITLDSEACAPCQYMVESVKRIVPEFAGVVEWREHKIKQRESLVFMSSLMVRNIPTICIDGQITFVSRIPPRNELIAAIQKRIIEKLRIKISHRQGEVHVLCAKGCDPEKRDALRQNIDHACKELGFDVPIKMVDDDDDIEAFGVLPSQTPALVTVKYQVKSTGVIPTPSVIREWLKDIQ